MASRDFYALIFYAFRMGLDKNADYFHIRGAKYADYFNIHRAKNADYFHIYRAKYADYFTKRSCRHAWLMVQ